MATCDAERRNVWLALVNRLPERALACRVIMDGAPLHGAYGADASTKALGDMVPPLTSFGTCCTLSVEETGCATG
jgi:hypothetical protein